MWGNLPFDLTVDGDTNVTVLQSAVEPAKVDDALEVIDWGDPDQNVSIDPFFCDPVPPGRTGEGGYTVDAVSPCLPEYRPDGLLIGACGVGCDTGLVMETPAGVDVDVVLVDLVLTFENVVAAGDSRQLIRNEGPELPANYGVVLADPAQFHHLTTDADYSGVITICFSYDEAELVGAEDSLRVLHYDETMQPPEWIDITSALDMELNQVCGVTASLSPFVVAERLVDMTVDDPLATPAGFRLYPASPNPFAGGTDIRYRLPAAAVVSVRIYGIDGREIRCLQSEVRQTAGEYCLRWDGCDREARPVSSGYYFYRVESSGVSQQRQMLLLR